MVGLRLCGRRQVFQQLEGLGGIVERLIGDVLKLAAAATREALDTSTLPADDEPGAKGRSAAAAAAMQQQRGPSKAHAAAWKTTLWSRMETLTEALLSRAGQVRRHVDRAQHRLDRLACGTQRMASTLSAARKQRRPPHAGGTLCLS